jgi:diamine N-acetyltransferase
MGRPYTRPAPADTVADVVSLRPLNASNRAAAEALRVAPGQERFVSSVTESLREAAEHPDARPLCFVVAAGDTPVGFVMLADEVASSEYIPQFLWKLLIDERHQRRGYGTATLDAVVAFFRQRPGAERVRTTAHPGDGSPIAFYERYGFVRTGEEFEGDVVLDLPLDA